MRDEDVDEMAEKIFEEAQALSEHLAILEEYEEESTWRKVLVVN